MQCECRAATPGASGGPLPVLRLPICPAVGYHDPLKVAGQDMKQLALMAITMVLLGCSTAVEPEFGEIQWYATNATGSAMTLVVYDINCRRSYFRIDLPRTGQVAVTTCQDSAGRSDIRYRRGGRISEGNPWRDTRMTSGQVLLVR